MTFLTKIEPSPRGEAGYYNNSPSDGVLTSLFLCVLTLGCHNDWCISCNDKSCLQWLYSTCKMQYNNDNDHNKLMHISAIVDILFMSGRMYTCTMFVSINQIYISQ